MNHTPGVGHDSGGTPQPHGPPPTERDDGRAKLQPNAGVFPPGSRAGESHMQTLIIYKRGFNQNYYTFILILQIKIVLCSEIR